MTNNQSPSKFPFKMRISGRFFTEGILSLEYKQRVPYSLDVIGSIQIDLENNLEFQHVDFKDDIEIYKEDKLHFKGFVTNYQSTDKIGTINFRDYSLKLEDEKITAEFINMNPTDSLALLTQSSGFLFRPSPKIPYNTDERDFVLIIPVLNLTTAESFKIGNVEFYQKFDTIDDSLIQNSETGKKNLLWSSNFPRAKIIIKSRNFFDAIIKGYASISKTIDIIALRTDISFPSMNINADYYRFAFNHDTLLSKVKIPTCVYCREKNSQAIAFFDIESINEKKLSLNVNSQGFFKEVITLCDDLIEKDEFIKDENNFLQVLHWLRKAIQEGNDKDKFLDLWIAFEFLISGEKNYAAIYT